MTARNRQCPKCKLVKRIESFGGRETCLMCLRKPKLAAKAQDGRLCWDLKGSKVRGIPRHEKETR